MLLNLTDLSISFKTDDEKSFHLDSLSLSVDRGKCLGIVGESGSGKSLSSLALMGLLPKKAVINSGRAIFRSEENLDIDLLSLNDNELRKIRGNKISMIFQEPMTSLNPVLTCGFQVYEVLETHLGMNFKEAKARTIELFEEVDLPRPEDIFNSYPHQLSGGQKQRIMIAMAIACKPKLLIADEPTTALDVSVQSKILKLLMDLKDKYNMGIIFISHDLGVIADIADYIIVMNKGKVMESGEAKTLLQSPQNNYTKGLLACVSGLRNKDIRLPVVDNYSAISQNEQENINKPRINYHSENKEVILEIKKLKVSYTTKNSFSGKVKSTVKALDNVSLQVYKGETLGLVGESGCGKSTLGRSIARLINSNEGDIIYKGNLISNLSKSEFRNYRRKIQIIFQDPYSSLNPGMSVGEAILEPIVFHKIAGRKDGKIKVIELLNNVGLDSEYFYRYPHELSGGQRQRIVIARALGLNPEFIICDESVSALDVSVQAQVLNLLNDLKEKFSLTYIFISHDLNVIRYMSDRILVMKNGEIVESGTSESIYYNPKNQYTKDLLSSIPGLIQK